VAGIAWGNGAGGVDSVVRAMYFQRAISPAGRNYFVGEEGVRLKYIAVGSYWLGAVCALGAVAGGMSDALGIAFVRIFTKGNVIDVRSLLDAGFLFLFIASPRPTTSGCNRGSGVREPRDVSAAAGFIAADSRGVVRIARAHAHCDFSWRELPVMAGACYSAFFSLRRDLFSSRKARRSSATPSRRFHCS
jgi:hypothetical protein